MEDKFMNNVQRTRGIRRTIRIHVMKNPARKYTTAGSNACGRMMLDASRCRIPGPSDSAILAWAQFDLNREILGGYWQQAS